MGGGGAATLAGGTAARAGAGAAEPEACAGAAPAAPEAVFITGAAFDGGGALGGIMSPLTSNAANTPDGPETFLARPTTAAGNPCLPWRQTLETAPRWLSIRC